MRLEKPLKFCIINQPFGVNYIDFYTKLGLKGHNGIDFKAPHNTPIYASHDGIIKWSGDNNGYGINILLEGYDNKLNIFQTIYGHLLETRVLINQEVFAQELIGYADNTGIYTTGDHLHFGLRFLNFNGSIKNYQNGYNGWIDPSEYMEEDWLKFPVDLKYNQQKRWSDEFKMLFKNIWLQKQLLKMGRNPPLLTWKELNALIYGYWSFDEVMNPSLYPIWAFLTKPAYLNGEKPSFKLTS